MHDHSFSAAANASSANLIQPPPAPQSAEQPSDPHGELIRLFNTAIISTRTQASRDYSTELAQLVESPAFRAILNAVRQYSRLQGITERQAAEDVVRTFRKIDQVWVDYIMEEGIDRLRQ